MSLGIQPTQASSAPRTVTDSITNTLGQLRIMEPAILRLPLELRQEIYKYAFDAKDETVLPLGKPRRSGRWERIDFRPGFIDKFTEFPIHAREYPIHNVLSTLLTCRKIYEEATAFLYGHYTFYFDDTNVSSYVPVPERYIEMDLTEYCDWCKRERRYEEHGWDTTSDRSLQCWESVYGKHIGRLNYCDIVETIPWLQKIGDRNRAFIRKICFHITNDTYTKFLSIWLERKPNEGYKRHPSAVGGELFEETLRYIANNLNAPTLRFTFKRIDRRLWKTETMINDQYVYQMRRIINIKADLFLSPSRLRQVLMDSLAKGKVRKLEVEGFLPHWQEILLSHNSLSLLETMNDVQDAITVDKKALALERQALLAIIPAEKGVEDTIEDDW